MAELKTKKNQNSYLKFIQTIKDKQQQTDAQELVKIFKDATKEKPIMWGDSIIGFGEYHYESSRSSQKGDWMLTAFSPRKKHITLYIMPGFKNYENLLKKLGKHKISSGCCLYINKLSDVKIPVLKKLIAQSYKDMKKANT